jgi:GNAT superfamily N-acetyltransferase
MSTRRTPLRSLPAKASEEFLHKQAKRYSKSHDLGLVAAQRVLAHEYGHQNWAELIAAARTVLRPANVRGRTHRTESSGEVELHDEEWGAIRSLADASLEEMKKAPVQKEWLDNRKSFVEAGGLQEQFVAMVDDQIVGYAAAEHPPAWMRNKADADGEHRLFVVVEPSARKTLGVRLLAALGKYLAEHGARRAWFQEYETDKGLVFFLERMGFIKRISFTSDNGERIIRLSMDAPFDQLTLPDRPVLPDHRESASRPPARGGEVRR